MSSADQLLKTINHWAKNNEDIRLLLLLGSRANKRKIDQVSDIDLALFSRDPQQYFSHLEWFQTFDSVWLSIPKDEGDHFSWKVIYEGGLMVDFAIYPEQALASMREVLPPFLEPGYKILLDRDRLARSIPKPSKKQVPPESPTAETFHTSVEKFWFNAYHVAKYILRDDLWRAKYYDWELKQHLLQMMGWHAVVVRRQEDFSIYEGRYLKEWLDLGTYTDLMTAFGRFYPADSWRALEDSIKIYTKLAAEVADTLQIDAREGLKEKFIGLIQGLKANQNQ